MDRLVMMRSFRRTVERGSFAQAAEDLDMSPAGLSKQIKTLEEELGTLLIQRTTRRMALTEVGETYYTECCRILDELDALENQVRGRAGRITGSLRVNAPLSLGLSILPALLPDFLAAHPELNLDLTLEDRLLDPVGNGFDISLRAQASLGDSTLIARRLADVGQVLCASPAYLREHGTPQRASDLSDHALLAYTLSDTPGRWRLEGPQGPVNIPLHPRLSANSSLLLRDMVAAGMGIGSLPSFVADAAIARGELIPLLPDHPLPPRQIFAVYATNRHLEPKTRVFIDYLAEALPLALTRLGSPVQPAI